MAEKLSKEFFSRNTVEVAQDLLGKKLYFYGKSGLITETEAYRGADDAASHAYCKRTPRNSIMFEEAGYSYVYFIYGMYYCFNIVTEVTGEAGAVLIRGLWADKYYNGPGKLCRYLGITKMYNALDLKKHSAFYIENTNLSPNYYTTPRIGISKAQEKLWRFVLKKDINF